MAIDILDSESHYAKRRRQHLTLINTLRALGAQADLDLPRIAVIGNQSAGKSSLVEAISGISVPRDAGTCTRCPIECRMADSEDEWRCRVSIRWEFHSDGRRLDKVEELAFGDVITDPQDVELVLRQAQTAVLNPSKDESSFLGLSEATLKQRGTKNELPFSRNAVCVDLSGPGLVDLAFVDLPGIIQNAEPHIVQFVEDLVLSQIQGNCLILVTLPMSDDIENQKAMSLARQVDPAGSRTIGVLTKPDTLTSGATRSKELWLDVIEGRNPKFPLRLGYYCTRQPDEDERRAGITSAEARQAESEFFARTSPWSATSQPLHFGTRNLVAHLSKLLTRIIDDSLPNIASETTRQLDDCNTRLAAMPPRIEEPASFVLALLTRFCMQVSAFVEGALDAAALVQECRGVYTGYKISIRATAPDFLPYPNLAAAGPELQAGRALKFLRLDEEDAGTASADASYLCLDDVRSRINLAITRELPNNIPYVAKVSFIKDFQRHWPTYTRRCVDAVYAALQQTALHLVHTMFGPYAHLEPKIKRAVEQLIREKLDATMAQTARILRYETAPFTQNDHYLSASKDKFLAMYKSARKNEKDTPKGKAAAASVHTPGAAPAPPSAPRLVRPIPTPAPPTPAPPPSTPQAPPAATSPFSFTSGAAKTPATTQVRRYNCLGTEWFLGPIVEEAPGSGVFVQYESVSCMSEYKRWSFEELRVGDYQQGLAAPTANDAASTPAQKKQKAAPTPNPFSLSASEANGKFGGTAFAPASPSVGLGLPPKPMSFGSPTPTLPLFGQSAASDQPPAPVVLPALPSYALLNGSAASTPAAGGLPDEERKQAELEVLAGLAKLGYTNIDVADLGKLVPPDEYERELEVMAEVRAYFKVAYKRVIDYVPLVIDHEFLRAFADALQEHLVRQLGLGAADGAAKCAAYLEENPFVTATRDELTSRKARLESVRDELAGFGL
ncbi:P-loop containing nucleoside triphosphate hydrolase protein [Phanerochaete sordida]|uniref:P-loop containing nucleoside triphosphate hydrolase protein n=1 Tax=Phanerochaete sordida TaxID=48140 RepID=A0A9P3LIY7_9APHY|nr:P-loop containing nucleoside triphosphate hydrolase protein [Phanerochaete sordida]